MNNYFMILSHHRSGSNFLCNLLSINPEIECLNEPLSMHTDFFKNNDLIKWKKEEYNPRILHKSLYNSQGLVDYLKEFREYLSDDKINKMIGFKETLLFEKMEWLKEFLPNLKIIYLVRDPRAVVNSAMRNTMYHKWQYEKTIPRYLLTYENTKVNKDNGLELVVWSWKIRYKLFQENKHLFDNIIVKLEDIVEQPCEELNKIMKFIEKEPSYRQLQFLDNVYGTRKKGLDFSSYTTKDRVLNDWKGKLKKDERKFIEQRLNEEMVQLRYI